VIIRTTIPPLPSATQNLDNKNSKIEHSLPAAFCHPATQIKAPTTPALPSATQNLDNKNSKIEHSLTSPTRQQDIKLDYFLLTRNLLEESPLNVKVSDIENKTKHTLSFNKHRALGKALYSYTKELSDLVLRPPEDSSNLTKKMHIAKNNFIRKGNLLLHGYSGTLLKLVLALGVGLFTFYLSTSLALKSVIKIGLITTTTGSTLWLAPKIIGCTIARKLGFFEREHSIKDYAEAVHVFYKPMSP
jgi:hypothetical protein